MREITVVDYTLCISFSFQSSTTVNGALSLMLDSMLCALGPLIYMTSFVPQMKAIEPKDMVRDYLERSLSRTEF